MSLGGTLCFVPPAGPIITGIAVTVVPVPLNAVAGLLGMIAFEYDVSAGTFVIDCVSCGAGSDCSGCVPSGASTDWFERGVTRAVGRAACSIRLVAGGYTRPEPVAACVGNRTLICWKSRRYIQTTVREYGII